MPAAFNFQTDLSPSVSPCLLLPLRPLSQVRACVFLSFSIYPLPLLFFLLFHTLPPFLPPLSLPVSPSLLPTPVILPFLLLSLPAPPSCPPPTRLADRFCPVGNTLYSPTALWCGGYVTLTQGKRCSHNQSFCFQPEGVDRDPCFHPFLWLYLPSLWIGVEKKERLT